MNTSLIEVIPDGLWEPLGDSDDRWVRVLFADSTIFGISSTGELLIKQGGIISKIACANTVKSLVFLEHSPQKHISNVTARFGQVVGQELIERIQLVDIVRAGLVQGSDYWADLALSWCSQLQCASFVATELKDVQSSKWASQKSRQMAKKLLSGIDN